MMILKQVLHIQSGMGSKYLEYNPGSELSIFLMKNEQWTKESNENKSWTKDEQNSNNNKINELQNKIIHDITGTWALCAT